ITGDTTAPEAPDVEDITNNFVDNGNVESTTVTGTAEPGSTVIIKDENGNIVGETTADDDGNFEVVVECGGLADGEEYDVTATDKAGNESDPTTITGDTTAPAISDITVVQVDSDNPADGEADKTVVTFKGDDDTATYTATGPNGEEAVIEGP